MFNEHRNQMEKISRHHVSEKWYEEASGGNVA